MKRILLSLLIIAALALSVMWGNVFFSSDVEDSKPLTPRETLFDYYGWFAVDYDASTPAQKRIRTYTNTAFAATARQAAILKEMHFAHIVYIFNVEETLDQIVRDRNIAVPQMMIKYEGNQYESGVSDYAAGISNFRETFFVSYRAKLLELKQSLERADTLDAVDIFYLADEPALHRNIYLDQAFLNQIVTEFKTVFPDKKTMMIFAQNPDPAGNPFPGTGLHLSPPTSLDIVVVDPYIDPLKVSCERSSVRDWLYNDNPYSNIAWAKKYGKPIIVAGDAQLRNGTPIDPCYHQAIFEILDAGDIDGLIWFAYDKSYREEELSGAANNPEFVHMIERLGSETVRVRSH